MTDPVSKDSDLRRAYWDNVYATKASTEVSWFQETPTPLLLIEATGVGPDARIIDVGGGASNLVDALVARGFNDVTVLDIAVQGLDAAKVRMGAEAEQVNWIVADATNWTPEGLYDLWHDRATFHFLTELSDQEAYMDRLRAAVGPGGHVVISTFSEEGPKRCSGLAVVRRNPERIGYALRENFELRKALYEDHHTPSGSVQNFVHCWFQRRQ